MPGLARQIVSAFTGVALATMSADLVRTLMVCNVRSGDVSVREMFHSVAFIPRSVAITAVLPGSTRDAAFALCAIAVVLLIATWRLTGLRLRFLSSLRGLAIAVIVFVAAGAVFGFVYDSTSPVAYDC